MAEKHAKIDVKIDAKIDVISNCSLERFFVSTFVIIEAVKAPKLQDGTYLRQRRKNLIFLEP